MDLNRRIESFRLEDQIISPIMELSTRLLQFQKTVFSQQNVDITQSQWEALNQLWAEEGLTQAELAEKIHKDRPYTTRMVDDLEKKSLLYRKQDRADRRSNRIYLTARGRTLKYQILPEYFRRTDELFGILSEEEAESLRKICAKLIAGIE